MGNKGAFISLEGKDMIPKYTTYEGTLFYKLVGRWNYVGSYIRVEFFRVVLWIQIQEAVIDRTV